MQSAEGVERVEDGSSEMRVVGGSCSGERSEIVSELSDVADLESDVGIDDVWQL